MRHHRRITGSGLNAHMDDQAIPLEEVRRVRRVQRAIGRHMDELNELTKQLAVIWMRFPPASSTGTPLGEAVKSLDVIMLTGDQVCGWLDDWVLAREAREAKGQAHNG